MDGTAQNIFSITMEKQEEEQYCPPKQSANTLFRFFKKPDYLFTALENMAMIPRYYGENVDYLNIGFHQIAYPMVCFCDINIHKLGEHMNLYGNYGIAFSKSWGINHGIQPLQYVNKHSILRKDFTTAFLSALKADGDHPGYDFLLTQMLYFKPIEGTMPRDGIDIMKNFTDECEWRYIPSVSLLDLPQAVLEDEIASIDVLNKTLADHKDSWLKFEYNDIKYIILQSENDFYELCKFLDIDCRGSFCLYGTIRMYFFHIEYINRFVNILRCEFRFG